MGTSKNRSGKKRKKRKKAAPRKSAAEQEAKSKKKAESEITVEDGFVRRGNRLVPIVKDSDLPPIPSLPDSARHVQTMNKPRARNEDLPSEASKIATANPPKMKTFAEQAGAARHDELQQDKARRMRRVHSEKEAEHGKQTMDLSNPLSAMCPNELREPQPSDFRPAEQLRQFVDSFCNSPQTNQGPALIRRVHYDVVDQPTIPISDAEMAGLEPVFIAGRQIESSPTKRYCGYDCPSPDTYMEVESKVRQILEAWDAGKEAAYKKPAIEAGKRKVMDDTNSRGEPIKTRPPIDKFSYRQSIYIYRPMDDAGQICVVVI